MPAKRRVTGARKRKKVRKGVSVAAARKTLNAARSKHIKSIKPLHRAEAAHTKAKTRHKKTLSAYDKAYVCLLYTSPSPRD